MQRRRAPKSYARGNFMTSLAKSGYWLPGIAWENTFISGAISQGLGSEQESGGRPNTVVSLTALVAAAHATSLRYCTGQVVLDNDICREAFSSKSGACDGDADRPAVEREMRGLLLKCT